MSKKTKHKNYNSNKKTVISSKVSSDSEKIIWVFDDVDKDGKFAFNLDEIERQSNLKEIFDKILAYSSMTWGKIKKQTHDDGRSKHHNLSVDKLTKDAVNRINIKCDDNDYDSIFSFALQNKLRIIGVREKNLFHVKWYDPNHEFYHISKKHT